MWSSALSILFLGAACAGKTDVSNSLVRARVMNQTVAQSNVAELAPAEVSEARRLLANAERVNQKKPDSNLERHLANLSHAKFEEAVAEAHRRGVESRLAQAQSSLSDEQLAALEAERKARLEAEAEAEDALERLRGIGTVRETEEVPSSR